MNTNLWLYERNFADFARALKLSGEPDWAARAAARKAAIDRYLWRPDRGLYMDYDFVQGRTAEIPCAVTFWPLWAGLASPEQARAVLGNLALFEQGNGIGACANTLPQTPRSFQWDADAAWPHLRIIVVSALDRYGFKTEARRVAARFLDHQAAMFVKPRPALLGSRAEFAAKRGPVAAPAGRTWEKYAANRPTLDTDEYGVGQCIQVSPAAAILFHRYLTR